MADQSLWSPIRALSMQSMGAHSRVAWTRDTLVKWRSELLKSHEQREAYTSELAVVRQEVANQNYDRVERLEALMRLIIELDTSMETLGTKIGQMEHDFPGLVVHQTNLRQELEEKLVNLRSFKYVTVSEPEDFHALQILKYLGSKNALAFTLGGLNDPSVIGEICSMIMGIENMKIGKLYKVEEGEFSEVREEEYGRFDFHPEEL